MVNKIFRKLLCAGGKICPDFYLARNCPSWMNSLYKTAISVHEVPRVVGHTDINSNHGTTNSPQRQITYWASFILVVYVVLRLMGYVIIKAVGRNNTTGNDGLDVILSSKGFWAHESQGLAVTLGFLAVQATLLVAVAFAGKFERNFLDERQQPLVIIDNINLFGSIGVSIYAIDGVIWAVNEGQSGLEACLSLAVAAASISIGVLWKDGYLDSFFSNVSSRREASKAKKAKATLRKARNEAIPIAGRLGALASVLGGVALVLLIGIIVSGAIEEGLPLDFLKLERTLWRMLLVISTWFGLVLVTLLVAIIFPFWMPYTRFLGIFFLVAVVLLAFFVEFCIIYFFGFEKEWAGNISILVFWGSSLAAVFLIPAWVRQRITLLDQWLNMGELAT